MLSRIAWSAVDVTFKVYWKHRTVNWMSSGVSFAKCWVVSAYAESRSLSGHISGEIAESVQHPNPAEWALVRWGEERSFIYLRTSTRCGSVFFCLVTASFPRISFVFRSKKHHLSSSSDIKKVNFFLHSAICHSFHHSYVSTLPTWSAADTVLFPRENPLSKSWIDFVFLLFLLFLCLDSSPTLYFLGVRSRNSLGRFLQ